MSAILSFDRSPAAAGAVETTPKKGDILFYGDRKGVYLGWNYLDCYAVREHGNDETLYYSPTFVTHWLAGNGGAA